MMFEMEEETINYSQGEFLCRDNENITINNNFSNCGLKNLDDIIGHINPECERLDISNNSLEMLDFEKLPETISSVTASNNDIMNVNFKNRVFENVYLNCNNILSGTIENAIVNKLFMRKGFNGCITNLTIKNSIIGKLVLDDNVLNEVIFENTTISNLSISDNFLEMINSLPQGLERLFLSKNRINCITVNFENTIKILDLSSNNIQGIHFNLPENLEKLYLGSNRIKEIEISFPKTLQSADLSNNYLKNVTNLTINDDLQELDLSSNELEKKVDSIEYGGLLSFNLEDNNYNRENSNSFSYLEYDNYNVGYDNDIDNNSNGESSGSDVEIRAIIDNDSDTSISEKCFIPEFENEDNETNSFSEFIEQDKNPDHEELRNLRSLFYDNKKEEENTKISNIFSKKYGNLEEFRERMNQRNNVSFEFNFPKKKQINTDTIPVILRWKD